MLKYLKIFSLSLLIFSTSTYFFVYYTSMSFQSEIMPKQFSIVLNDNECSFMYMKPFDIEDDRYFHKLEYQPCIKTQLLSYLKDYYKKTFLNLDTDLLKTYKNVECFVRTILRTFKNDSSVSLRLPVIFSDYIELNENPVKVTCRKNKKIIYSNVHTPVSINNLTEKKLKLNKNYNPLSVMIIGIDGVSRLNFMRTLPKTYKFLRNDTQWLSFFGYNKIGDNTYPNIMAMLTGNNQIKEKTPGCDAENNSFDNCPIIWKDYSKFGYVTAYAEDEVAISTFNLGKKGFLDPPTDYYFRPYFIAAETQLKRKKIDHMLYCTGPETNGERMLNIITRFGLNFYRKPTFSLFWMNSLSHSSLNALSMFDDKILEFWQNLNGNDVLKHTIVFFLSDHGLRSSEFRKTSRGWFEERLPFLFIWIPKVFQDKFPVQFDTIRNNVDKLTTPYDIYMTLQHLLVLSGHNYAITKTPGLNSKSLFTEIEKYRSCKNAGIPIEWCSCIKLKQFNTNSRLAILATDFLIESINQIIIDSKAEANCSQFTLKEIMVSNIYEKTNILVITLETKPEAIFEGLVQFKPIENNYEFSANIERIDRYEPHSQCVQNNPYLKNFCYCF